ncbi:hypothetical protein OAO87_01410 [bacterium]|nr:hypothetical protein [bacterium]
MRLAPCACVWPRGAQAYCAARVCGAQSVAMKVWMSHISFDSLTVMLSGHLAATQSLLTSAAEIDLSCPSSSQSSS